CKLT
ncbi:efflux transporter, RND family, MFP subunit, partial [Vibrio parahaemolyticus V-223/04]